MPVYMASSFEGWLVCGLSCLIVCGMAQWARVAKGRE